MKTTCIYIFFLLNSYHVLSQNIDVTVSYVMRELQIYLAKWYSSDLNESISKYTEYAATSATFYKLTGTYTNTSSSFDFEFPRNPCITSWGPIKYNRCRNKINLLEDAKELVEDIVTTNTNHPPKSAVQNQIILKANSILRDINKELLNH